MPVLGHAFVGVATAIAVPPQPALRARGPAATALWAPAVVALAYAPDIASQLGRLAGLTGTRAVAHSLVAALPAGAALAALLAAAFGISARRAAAVALGSIFGHDLLDLLQSTDRRPLWPLSDRHVTLAVIPESARLEALVFAAAFLLFLACRWWAVRRGTLAALVPAPPRRGIEWLGLAATAALVVAAAATHHLRSVREDQLESAAGLIDRRQFAEALPLLSAARRWPATARPGRIDDLEGDAWLGLGECRRAERHYLAADDADPTFFWAVADLATFYASLDVPLAERQRRSSPYVERLRRDFAGHRELPAVLARIDRRLREPPTGRCR